jgi:hypothetical protein
VTRAGGRTTLGAMQRSPAIQPRPRATTLCVSPAGRRAAPLGVSDQLRLTGVCALLALAACSSTEGPPPPVALGSWLTYEAYVGEGVLSGVACGDLDPQSPGDELIAVGQGGKIVILRCKEGRFSAEELEPAPGELLQVAVGDLDPMRPGAEAVAVGIAVGAEDDGGEGIAWLISRGEGGFERTELHRAGALLHAVSVADVDRDRAGNEVALAGFTREVLVMPPTSGAEARTVATLSGNAKGMAATERGLVVACDDGSLVLLERPTDVGGEWTVARTWREAQPMARVAARRGEVLVCGNDGVLRLHQVDPTGAFERSTRCFESEQRLRGAVLADVDPSRPGLEAATAGYDGLVRVVYLTPWPVADDLVPPSAGLVDYRVQVEVVAEDVDALHHLGAGNFDGIGPSLVTAGFSGRVLVVARER